MVTGTNFDLIPEEDNVLGRMIYDIAFDIHRKVGPGLVERVYEECFCYALKKRQIEFQRQVWLPITYDELKVPNGLRIDLLVGDRVIVELKAQADYSSLWKSQVLSYLKMSGLRLGYIINFHSPLLTEGLKRIVH